MGLKGINEKISQGVDDSLLFTLYKEGMRRENLGCAAAEGKSRERERGSEGVRKKFLPRDDPETKLRVHPPLLGKWRENWGLETFSCDMSLR